MVDLAVVERLLQNLDAFLAQLQAKQTVTRDRYLTEPDFQAIIERRLEESIQTCVDLGNHLVSQENWRKPSTYREVFRVLQEQGVLSAPLADAMGELAGFRNVLAHDYADILHERVFEIFQQSTATFQEYRKAIVKFLQKAS